MYMHRMHIVIDIFFFCCYYLFNSIFFFYLVCNLLFFFFLSLSPCLSSFTDHPLNRLLGECQYNVYMMLQPVGSAIEKAGGLPRLHIRLDNCGMDRKPSEGQ